MHLANFVVNIP